jgi:hypothetical protein
MILSGVSATVCPHVTLELYLCSPTQFGNSLVQGNMNRKASGCDRLLTTRSRLPRIS